MSESRAGLITLGETLGRITIDPGRPLAQAAHALLGVGGAESNVAIGVRRLGMPATWIGRVGDDGFGARVLRELRAEAVQVRSVVGAGPTAVMIQETRVPGRTRVSYHRRDSAGSRLAPEDVEAADFEAADFLHLTGITPALSLSAAAAVDRALDLARDAGVRVSFDVNHRSTLWQGRDPAPTYAALAARADVVLAGLDEAALLTGVMSRDPEVVLDALAESTGGDRVLKLGEEGCVADIDGIRHHLPAVSVLPVDTVGAGDAFVAGYLVGWSDGLDPVDRLEQAVRCGAVACLSPGDWEGLATRRDLALLDPQDPVSR